MNMTQSATVSVVAAALLALAFTAADARSRTDQRFGMDDQGSSRGEQWKHISGTIKKMKEVEVRGRDQDNLVVQLQTDRGGRTIVDLGNVEHLEDLDLEKGDRLTAWGRTVKISDKRVFMAHKIRANDETVEVERQSLSRRDMRQRGREPYDFGTSGEDRSRHPSSGAQSADHQ